MLVQVIYDRLQTEVANLITAKLISHLAKYHGISVVESEDKADAILTGSGLVQSTTNAYGHPTYHVKGAMRLDSKDGVVLCGGEGGENRCKKNRENARVKNPLRRENLRIENSSLHRAFSGRKSKTCTRRL